MQRSVRKMLGALVAMMVIAAGISAVAYAATTVYVTPTNTQGWTTVDTRPGGAVNYVSDSAAPGGSALQLTTDATTTAKAQYMHAAATPLSSVNELSYSTKQNSALIPAGDPSYQLPVCLGGTAGGTCSGFTTLVFEPYENTDQGLVIPGVWQSWNVAAGQFWSSRSYTNGSCAVVAGGGGAPFYTLSELRAACPDAVVVGFGVNIGTNNPSYDVETDLVDFNGTTYNFQLPNPPSASSDCKNGGWNTLTDGNGVPFNNQGDCESYYQSAHNHGHTK